MSIRTEVDGVCVFVVDSGPPEHRRPIWPGMYVSPDVWRDTDISGEEPLVAAACNAAWTPAAVASYKVLAPKPPLPKSDSQTDAEELNAALVAQGSVVRALGLVMFAEINKLRVKGGDPAYTMNQFTAALKAQMRS